MLKDCGIILLIVLLIVSIWKFDLALFKFLGIVALILLLFLMFI